MMMDDDDDYADAAAADDDDDAEVLALQVTRQLSHIVTYSPPDTVQRPLGCASRSTGWWCVGVWACGRVVAGRGRLPAFLHAGETTPGKCRRWPWPWPWP